MKIKVYTKKGDQGMTTINKNRISKASTEIELVGELDLLQSNIGMLILQAHQLSEEELKLLKLIQSHLFILSSFITGYLDEFYFDCSILEKEIDRYNETLEPLKEFLYAGSNIQETWANLCRCQTRRVEVTLYRLDITSVSAKQFINRLSDYFYILSRVFLGDIKVKDISIKISEEVKSLSN